MSKKGSKKGTNLGQNQSTFSKYRSLIISIFMFVVIIIAVVVLNFLISFQITKGAIDVNLAGQQRALSQRMAKALLELEKNYPLGEEKFRDITRSIDELRLVRNKFDDSLQGFDVGKEVESSNASKGKVFLRAVESPVARENVEYTKVLWKPYVRRVDDLLNSWNPATGQLNETALKEIVTYALGNNLTLFTYSNNITNDLEQVSDNEAKRLRYVQIAGLALALLNFLVVIFYSVRKLRESDLKIEEARRETNEIMQTVSEGLFLVDKELNIGSQYSARLEKIIGQRNIGGKKLIDVLEKLVDKKDVETTSTFIDQLYSDWVVEELISDLNPLSKIKAEVDDFSGYFATKYLNFKFSRVYNGDTISHILVSVEDITDAVMLEEKLEQEREENNLQIEMLSTILNTDQTLLAGFLNATKRRINEINEILRNPDKSAAMMQEKVRKIYREVHSMKGEASALNLKSFVSSCQSFEEKVKDLQGRSNLMGDDFLGLAMMLDELLSLTNLVESLNQRITGGKVHSGIGGDVSTGGVMEKYFTNFAQDIAKRNDKEVSVICQGLDDAALTGNKQEIVKDITGQLLRNALVHGIEKPAVRQQRGKTEQGHVQIILSRLSNGEAELMVEDDGAGINYESIRAKAVSKGLYSESEAANLDKRQLILLMFGSGFSTAASTGEDAGRGVGMDIIKEHIRELNGRLKIASVFGQYSRFSITFPLK